MDAHEREFTPGKNPTRGGSRDTDANEPMVIPKGVPAEFTPVTTTTEVATWPSTERK